MLSIQPLTCRLCLTTEEVTINIFKYEFDYLPTMIQNCLPITIRENDRLPKCICQTCHNKVTLLHEFRNQALRAQQHIIMSLQMTNQNTFPQNQYPQSESRIMPAPTTYSQYIPENSTYSSCDQKNYEEMSEPAEHFCEVIQSNDLPISNLAETHASDPLASENNCNNSCVSPQNCLQNEDESKDINMQSVLVGISMLPRRQMESERKSPQTRTEPGDSSQKRIVDEVKNDCTEEVSSSRKRSITHVVKSRTSSTKPKLKPSSEKKISGSLVKNNVQKKVELLSDDKFSCDKCHFTTTSQSQYIMHSERHVRKYIVFCKECNISFLNKTEMTNHNIEKHDAPQFQCAHCNDVFTSKNTLYSHIKSHDPSNVHICEICGKTYKKKNSYKRHINRNHLGGAAKAQCAICERILSSKEHLRRHMLVHTDERNWVCSTCGKCYRSKCYLTEHTRIHAGIKPYKCEICGKCFTQSGSLTIHKRSHTGERPFRCEYCDRGFIISTLLRYHMKKCSLAPRDNTKIEPAAAISQTS